MTKPGYTPLAVARQLGISSSTLRRWTQHFGEFLSQEDGASGLRHYNEADLETLTEIKRLLDRGLTYEQALTEMRSQELEGRGVEREVEGVEEIEAGADPGADKTASLVGEIVGVDTAALTTTDEDSQVIDVGRLMAETLSSLSDSQKMILSGQQTERQLLGVLLQDNFNLKEENSRLRERMLEAERKLFELKRDMNEVQTTERERMRQMESNLFELQRRMDVLGGQRVSRQTAAANPPAAARPTAVPAPPPQAANPPVQPTAAESPPDSPPAAPTAAQPAPSPPAPEKQRWWQRLFRN